MKNENRCIGHHEFSELDFQGLFCGVLSRWLEGGTLTKMFIEDMKKRGVLADDKRCKFIENHLNFTIHGDRDFFAFNSSLMQKENTMSSYERLRKKLADEESDRQTLAEVMEMERHGRGENG